MEIRLARELKAGQSPGMKAEAEGRGQLARERMQQRRFTARIRRRKDSTSTHPAPSSDRGAPAPLRPLRRRSFGGGQLRRIPSVRLPTGNLPPPSFARSFWGVATSQAAHLKRASPKGCLPIRRHVTAAVAEALRTAPEPSQGLGLLARFYLPLMNPVERLH